MAQAEKFNWIEVVIYRTRSNAPAVPISFPRGGGGDDFSQLRLFRETAMAEDKRLREAYD